MPTNLYDIERDDDGIRITIKAKTAVYVRGVPTATPVCWDAKGNKFNVSAKRFLESWVFTPLGEIAYPAYIDIREVQDTNLLYAV